MLGSADVCMAAQLVPSMPDSTMDDAENMRQ